LLPWPGASAPRPFAQPCPRRGAGAMYCRAAVAHSSPQVVLQVNCTRCASGSASLCTHTVNGSQTRQCAGAAAPHVGVSPWRPSARGAPAGPDAGRRLRPRRTWGPAGLVPRAGGRFEAAQRPLPTADRAAGRGPAARAQRPTTPRSSTGQPQAAILRSTGAANTGATAVRRWTAAKTAQQRR
jgi:hypothetical protein